MNNSHHRWTLQPGALTLADLRAVWAAHFPITLAPEAAAPIAASAALVKTIVDKGDPAYGINTGFEHLDRAPVRPVISKCFPRRGGRWLGKTEPGANADR